MRVQISSDLKWKNHSVNKANKALGMLLKTFTIRDSDLWKMLYISLLRPHIEFASTVWNPYLKCDIEKLERVQRTTTKIRGEIEDVRFDDTRRETE